MKKIFLLLISVITVSSITISCEKDDICPAVIPTTPHLKIAFYDFTDRDVKKKVPTLRAIGVGTNTTLNTITDRDSKGIDSLLIPLKTFDTTTQFIFISESKDDSETEEEEELGNPDLITLLYENKEVFISRSCGYANNFENLEASFDFENDDDTWIKSIEVVNQIVKNQDSTHVKIYH